MISFLCVKYPEILTLTMSIRGDKRPLPLCLQQYTIAHNLNKAYRQLWKRIWIFDTKREIRVSIEWLVNAIVPGLSLDKGHSRTSQQQSGPGSSSGATVSWAATPGPTGRQLSHHISKVAGTCAEMNPKRAFHCRLKLSVRAWCTLCCTRSGYFSMTSVNWRRRETSIGSRTVAKIDRKLQLKTTVVRATPTAPPRYLNCIPAAKAEATHC
jgi:hypothetical protein